MNAHSEETARIRAVYHASDTARKRSATLYRLDKRARTEEGLVSTDGSLTFAELEWAAQELAVEQDSPVLDLACGTGAVTRALARRQGCYATGVDLMARRIRQGATASRKEKLDRWSSFVQADATRVLPFAADRFDSLLLIDALVHFCDRDLLCAEMGRILSPRGRLLICTVLGTHLSPEQARILEETTATLYRLELEDLLAVLERHHLDPRLQLDRTLQLSKWHTRRHQLLGESNQKLRAEMGDDRFERLVRREETTVELLETRALTSVMVVAENKKGLTD